MRKALLAVLAVAVTIIATPTVAQVVPGQYIVVLNDNVANPPAVAQQLAAQHGVQLLAVYQHALKGFAFAGPPVAAEGIARNPLVAYVEPDLEAHAFLHDNEFQILPTGVDRIDADLNTTANIDCMDPVVDPCLDQLGVDVDIAIIDTGIDLDHPDLNVFKNKSFMRRVKSGNDDNGHGSAVAGIAAALDNGIGVVGVAPGARLWALKVLDRTGSGSFSNVIKAIDFVTGKAGEIEVANMSLGGTGRLNSLRTAIQNSVAAGVVHVVAAGNSSSDVYGDDGVFEDPKGNNDDFIPAAYPEVATISAMGDTDGMAGGLGPDTTRNTADDTFADFTNFSNSVVAGNPVTSLGAAIDLAGPGVNITTTANDGLYFGNFGGTSASSPHVAGAAALEAATNGRATDATGVASIRQALIDAAEAQSAWGPANTNDPDENPEGLVNVASAGCGADSACDDDNLCTTDSCDLETGLCSNDMISCADLNACTADSCDPATGLCSNDFITCDDSSTCTNDSCDMVSGCVFVDNGTCDACVPIGASCGVNSDCCTNKCKGRPGKKTCK